ncbi:transcriptional regulator [Duganella sp. BuS-21]|uniref:transcriptional regulator n=1 Tax=Duganella sp. BuS-21 TaxID=2943848 RepID=UPI0035A5CD78
MKMKLKIAIALLLAASCSASFAASGAWMLSGGTQKSYEIGEDRSESVSGKAARYIRFVDGDAGGFGTLMQKISAENYKGKRVRFQAMVKTRDVSNWAGLWMRADRSGESSSAFYNSQDKPIAGTTDWQLRSVTLDIPEDAVGLYFGVIDSGKGQVWIDQLSLDVVGMDVPVDVQPGRGVLPSAPVL